MPVSTHASISQTLFGQTLCHIDMQDLTPAQLLSVTHKAGRSTSKRDSVFLQDIICSIPPKP